MGFTIKPSLDGFKTVCAQLGNWKRIQIARSQIGYTLAPAFEPTWIERVLRFFGFKKHCLRIGEVADFALNWLRAHALEFDAEFYQQITNITKLTPFMEKAGRKGDFEALIRAFREIYRTQAICLQKTFNSLSLIIKEFKFFWPTNFPKQRDIEQQIGEIIHMFLTNPGAIVNRIKKTTQVYVRIPGFQPKYWDLPIKVDFFLTGAIPERSIIVKTKEIVCRSNQGIVYRAFSLLRPLELLWKRFCSSEEKTIAQIIEDKRIRGFALRFAVREKGFYEIKPSPLSAYLDQPIPVRYKLVAQLIAAFRNLHSITLRKITYSVGDRLFKELRHVPAYHGDVQLEHISIFLNRDQELQIAISNLGKACMVSSPIYHTVFSSPQKALFVHRRIGPLTSDEMAQYHLSYGQSDDMWALGLVCATILNGSVMLNGLPPLECFNQHFEILSEGILQITQHEIDTSLDSLLKGYDESLKQVIKSMLQINAVCRITASAAFDRIHALNRTESESLSTHRSSSEGGRE